MHPISKTIIKCFRNGGKIFWAGNGGSASMAAHASGEFVGRFKKDRPALPSIALTTDLATITAIANDFGYENVFSRQLEALGKPGDLLLTLSTSGKSENIRQAHLMAMKLGMTWIKFPTNDDTKLPTDETQVHHLDTIHQIAREVEEEMFP